MTESKHTPGKVFISGGMVDGYELRSDNGEVIIFTKGVYNGLHHKANAARIVQCWNEYDQLKEENKRLKELHHLSVEAVLQRDKATTLNRELAEALKKALDTIETLATEFNYQSRRWRSEHIEPIINLIAKYNLTNARQRVKVQIQNFAGDFTIVDEYGKTVECEFETYKEAEKWAKNNGYKVV